MTLLDRLSLFSTLDMIAVSATIAIWLAVGWRIEHPSAKQQSVSKIMAESRREWLRQMLPREPRIFDAQTIATLRQGTSFLASTCVIAIGGCLALIGNTETLSGVAEELISTMQPKIVWDVKIFLVVFFLANGFLKFLWSNRLFGYCSVLMAAVPNDPDDPNAPRMANKAAELNVAAARSFNRGLRAVYFGLASMAWLAGPLSLMCASVVTLVVIWRREFASRSREVLLES